MEAVMEKRADSAHMKFRMARMRPEQTMYGRGTAQGMHRNLFGGALSGTMQSKLRNERITGRKECFCSIKVFEG